MHTRITKIERELDELRSENEEIRGNVAEIKTSIEKVPEHFSVKDVLRAFIGSLFLGFSIVFSGNLLMVAKVMPLEHCITIIAFTFVVLTAEIYFIGYKRVTQTEKRRFGQFWAKRIFAFYGVAFIVAFILIYIFGVIYLANNTTELIKAIIIVSGPAAIGASIGDLLKKY